MESLQQRASQIQFTRTLALLGVAIPFLLGYLGGVVVKMLKLGWAAVVIGYERGSHIGSNQ